MITLDGRLPSKNAMRNDCASRALGFDFLRGLAKGQRLGLRENVCQQDVVMPAERCESLGKTR